MYEKFSKFDSKVLPLKIPKIRFLAFFSKKLSKIRGLLIVPPRPASGNGQLQRPFRCNSRTVPLLCLNINESLRLDRPCRSFQIIVILEHVTRRDTKHRAVIFYLPTYRAYNSFYEYFVRICARYRSFHFSYVRKSLYRRDVTNVFAISYQ